MSVNVDPYIYPVMPKAFANDPELAKWFEYTSKHLHDLWKRTGGYSDLIAGADLNRYYNWSGSNLDNGVYVKSISANYTTCMTSMLVATSPLTITLNATPKDLETVTVFKKTTTGPIVVSGSINGDTVYNMWENYESKVFVFIAEENEWFVS